MFAAPNDRGPARAASEQWSPSLVIAGTKGIGIASAKFVRQSGSREWTPMGLTVVPLQPVEGAEPLIDVSGTRPHGIRYLGRYSRK